MRTHEFQGRCRSDLGFPGWRRFFHTKNTTQTSGSWSERPAALLVIAQSSQVLQVLKCRVCVRVEETAGGSAGTSGGCCGSAAWF